MDQHLLIRTKFFIPPLRAESVPRPRLLEHLNEGFNKKLILISAAAGFGKSTLLNQWAHQCPIPVAWLSLDEEDNDQTRFMVYLISALQTLFPGIGDHAMTMQQSPQPTPMQPDLTGLINEISLLRNDFVLVLDDYHLIHAENIHSGMAFFIEHLPAQIHLVISTRSDPPLPLALLLARGQMTELRSNDLRFTPEEVHTFLLTALKIDLDDSEIKALGARTEGWIAGLRLAAISLQGKSSDAIGSFVKDFTGSNRYILDYLVEEVLQRQPQNAQDFLLKTSILKRLCAPLCDALTGQDNGQEMLEHIEHENLFVEPMDDMRRWYRYHNLFSDLLRMRLQQTQPEMIAILHHKASDWYESNGLISQAIFHSMVIEDFEHAAHMIETVSLDILVHGEVAILNSWLDALPAAIRQNRPELDMVRIWIRIIDGHLENILQDVESVENRFRKLSATMDDERRKNLSLQINACHAYLNLHNGEFSLAFKMSKELLDSKETANPFIMAFRGLFSAFEVLLDQNGEKYPLDENALQQPPNGNSLIFLLAIYMSAYFHTLSGDMNTAIRLFEYGLHTAQQTAQESQYLPGKQQISPAIGLMYQGLGNTLRHQNRLEQAQKYLDLCLQYGEQWRNIEIQFDNYIAYAYLHIARGDLNAAEAVFDYILELKREHPLSPITARQWEAYQADLNIKQGRLHLAKRWSESLQDYPPDSYGNSFISIILYCIEQIVQGHYLIATKQYDKALERLQHIFETVHQQNAAFSWVELKVIQAMAYQGTGDIEQALACLQSIMEKARRETYISPFLNEGQPMIDLLIAYRQTLTRDNGLRSFVDELLAALKSRTQADGAVAIERPQSPEKETEEALSDRELQVLALIADGHSNKEIALEMNIALSTVKTHIHSLYRKLDITRRTQAVSKARKILS